VLDFACLQSKLAIEIDGAAHDSGRSQAQDGARDEWLANQGYRTLRVPARDVLDNLEGVVELVTSRCRAVQPLHHASHGPPPRAGEDAR
jgi:very-short-patch-repair endonuclease